MSVLVRVEAKAKPETREERRAFGHGNRHDMTAAEGCASVRCQANMDAPHGFLFVASGDTRTRYAPDRAWRYARGEPARRVALRAGAGRVSVCARLA